MPEGDNLDIHRDVESLLERKDQELSLIRKMENLVDLAVATESKGKGNLEDYSDGICSIDGWSEKHLALRWRARLKNSEEIEVNYRYFYSIGRHILLLTLPYDFVEDGHSKDKFSRRSMSGFNKNHGRRNRDRPLLIYRSDLEEGYFKDVMHPQSVKTKVSHVSGIKDADLVLAHDVMDDILDVLQSEICERYMNNQGSSG